jgi:hypothetical protein
MKNVNQIKTTLIGLVALLIPILGVAGWVAPEKIVFLTEQTPLLIEAGFVFGGLIAGFWAIFKTNDDGN